MTTPAQQAGIIPNVTRLRIDQNGARDSVWLLSSDDGTTLPYFKRENGTVGEECFFLNVCTIIEDESVPAAPVAPQAVMLAPPITICGETLQIVTHNPAVAPMTVWQRRAVDCFETMYVAADKYRRTGERGSLRYEYGICDNITRFTDYDDEMTNVKDNLIRSLPSYSGSYHYPVKPTEDHSSAERAWDYSGNKWEGGYGKNRLDQLGELVEALKSERWDDELIGKQTPATRLGLKIGDIVWHRDRNELLTFHTDDGSQDPYFTRPDGDRMSTHLDNIERDIAGVLTGEPIEVLIGRAKSIIAQREALRLQVVGLEQQMNQLLKDVGSIDVELAHTHGVKRINS